MERYGRYEQRTAPVNPGDELDVKIEAVGEKGDGIAKKDGFVLFVPNTKEGQECRIRVTKVLRKVGFAEVIGEAQSTPKSSQHAPSVRPAEDDPAPEDTENFGESEEPDTQESGNTSDETLDDAPEPSDDVQEAEDEEERQD